MQAPESMSTPTIWSSRCALASTWRLRAQRVPGVFASEIDNPRVRILGEATLPMPRRVSGEELASGVQDSQFVEVEGVVMSAGEDEGRLLLHIASKAVEFPVYVFGQEPAPEN